MLPPFFRGPDRVCSALEPAIACPGRVDAVAAGEFEWDQTIRAWTSPQTPRRSVSWRTYFYNEALGDAVGRKYTYDDCPWCGEPLPDLGAWWPAGDGGQGADAGGVP